MAKTKAQPSKRSRAARRATSPSIDTDKSLKTAAPPARGKPTERPSVLAVHHAAGVQKRTSQRKARVSAKARRRREKGMEMAEAVLERTSSKVKRSWDRQRTVDKRRQGWDAINKDVVEEEGEQSEAEGGGEGAVAKKTRTKKENGKRAERDEDEGWETEENAEAKPAQTAVDDDLDEIM
ncbi:hypothetical protein CRV24_001740 [Beauveria bassiana]|uniref:Ribosome biogenesis protein Alb1 n=1 Tax=Beauveria bassiana (strain ARSEF 2860) TaxID=655819 RepID=J5JPV5_BEAB2|nr:uncharacterized protein BBA_03702 [Beauveria bassiana ARSEF 2860]EJP67128.1 hypothetical protein BBA_03702 [Beauveria bassiana ARSEF 2860]KAF1739804.1 hypothetical protein CRV24_001740 [Beauveria bassiana]KAH8719636.1 hypothetical protein HC256_000068 [Beauveria bassiana]